MTDEQRRIPLSHIRPPRICLRPVRRNTPEYEELIESVKKDGILQPILVRPCDPESGHSYEIVEGWHRFEASKEAGKSDIPCFIQDMTDHDVLICQIKCNAIRPKTHSFEYVRRLKTLRAGGLSINQLSQLVDKSPRWINAQLCLNRLCEEARGPVERGEIKLKAALALANLPGELQVKFIDDAIAMPTKEFVERAEMALRDFKSYLLRLQQEDREIGAATPKIRKLNVLRREALKPRDADDVLKATRAKTALQGWEACMSWIFQLDPVSVKRRKENYREASNESLMNNDEYHLTNRELIRKFVNPQSELGDYHG
jgi:ParB family chromosome partitioning protein